jgi:hypothetical protein
MIRNYKLLPRIQKLWDPGLRRIRKLVCIRIPRLEEAGECTCISFVNNGICFLDRVDAIPLFIFLARLQVSDRVIQLT